MEFHQIYNKSVDGPYAKTGFIDIPLASIILLPSDATTDIAANGGMLASDTAPTLQTVDADTDSALRLVYIAEGIEVIGWQAFLPPDIDTNNPITVKVYAAMEDVNDTVVLALDTYFQVGDTKVEDASAAVTGVTPTVYTITVAAADIPEDARTVSMSVTPADTHDTDAMYVYSVSLEYTKL